MKKSCLTLVGILVGLAAGTQAALICDLDATVPGSVVTNESGVATDWLDQSGNGNNAGDETRVGNPTFPSASLSASGLAGIDFKPTRNGYRLFNSAEQDSWLDFTGAASGNSGFAVMVAVKVDGIGGGTVRDPVFANHGNAATAESFGLKYQDGQVTTFIGGQTFAKSGGTPVTAGDTLIIAFNYNATTGDFELWDSNNMSSLTNSKAAANFSSTQPLYLGTSENGGQYINGAIGEVLVYNEFLDATTFSNKYTELTDKWTVAVGILPPSGVTAVGSASSVVLDWADDATGLLDFYTVYRGTASGTNNYVALTNLSVSAYIDTDVTNGTPYYYAVTATDTNGVESAYSDEVSATPIEPSPDVTVSFPVTDTIFRNLMTLTLDYTVDGAGVVTLDASTSNGNAAPKAVVDAWDGVVGSVSNPALYNTSFTLTGVAKTNDVIVIQLSTDADNPGPGLGVMNPIINNAGLEKIEWTLTSAHDVVINFKSVEYTNRVANGDSNLTFLDEDSREEYLLPNTSTGGSIDLIGEGFSLSVGDTFVVTTDDFRDDGTTPRASTAGASLFGFVFEAVPTPPAPGIDVVFSYAGTNLNFATGESLTLDFSIDGSGVVSLDASTSNTNAAQIAAADAWDSSDVGFITNSALFGKTFSLVGTAERDAAAGAIILWSTDGGVLGVSGQNSGRIDGAGLATNALESLAWTVSGDVTVDFTSFAHGNIHTGDGGIKLMDSDTTELFDFTVVGTPVDLTGLGFSVGAGQALVFSADTNFVNGAGLAGFSFDISAAQAMTYAGWAAQYPTLFGGMGDDDDNDGLNNLYEFAVGGDPTNGTVAPAYMPTSSLVDVGGSSNVLEYVYTRRQPVPVDMQYYCEVDTQGLTVPNWTNDGYSVTGEADAAEGFKTVTNQTPVAEAKKFIKLVVEQN